MSEVTANQPMTSADLFAMRPSKKVDRWLFRGELRESKVTKRNPFHCAATANVSGLLIAWLKARPEPRGKVYAGEAYFRIRTDPDTNVGIDVAVSTPEQAVATSKKAAFVEGAPVLAVEVLSPYDKQREIDETIEEYLACGVRVVWIVNPFHDTVTVYRPGAEPVLYNRSQVIEGEPELPGFRCRVAEIFE
jgi:Uma2 family endonuclease